MRGWRLCVAFTSAALVSCTDLPTRPDPPLAGPAQPSFAKGGQTNGGGSRGGGKNGPPPTTITIHDSESLASDMLGPYTDQDASGDDCVFAVLRDGSRAELDPDRRKKGKKSVCPRSATVTLTSLHLQDSPHLDEPTHLTATLGDLRFRVADDANGLAGTGTINAALGCDSRGLRFNPDLAGFEESHSLVVVDEGASWRLDSNPAANLAGCRDPDDPDTTRYYHVDMSLGVIKP